MPTDLAASAAPASKSRTFFKRLVSTVVLWTVVLGALFSGILLVADLAVLVVVNVISVFALLEFSDLLRQRGFHCFRGYAGAAGAVFLTGVWLAETGRVFAGVSPLVVNLSFSSMIVVGLLVRRLAWPNMRDGLAAMGGTLFALAYVPWLLGFLMGIYFHSGTNGSWWLLYFILVTKVSDMGAYLVGSLIGRHKMIPRISPGKTWEGVGGAIAISVGTSLVFAHFAQERLVGLTFLHALVLGILRGGGAVVGDLVESLMKREAGVKDSGAYFPGIGGVLDLVDSLLFNAPIMFAYLVWLTAVN
jgi:phosphatidate cytidylyltransferase